MQHIKGFKLSGIHSGIKQNEILDLGLICAHEPVPTAAVFTRNIVRAAPVDIAQKRVSSGTAQALLVNSGNANACTGSAGVAATLETTQTLADSLNIDSALVLPASTGVIGQTLPTRTITNAIPQLLSALNLGGTEDFAKAILTTDQFVKVSSTTFQTHENQTVSVLGIAKGAGMIHPNMATTLAFVLTDACVDHTALQQALSTATESTFNCISVDGDTSTNDAIFAMASGLANNTCITVQHPDMPNLTNALTHVLDELSQLIVRDGEGAERKVKIVVEQAASLSDAKKIANTIATSSLVKTALHGCDPNWGRIIAAAGRAEVSFDPQSLDLFFDDVQLVKSCEYLGQDQERKAAQVMKQECFTIRLSLHQGPHVAHCWTCDLGHEYIRINADYRS